MIASIVSALVQLLVVLALAGLLHLVWGRKRKPFSKLSGLRSAPLRSIMLGLALGVAFALMIFAIPGSGEALRSPGTVTGDAIRTGISGPVIVALIATALIKTSLAEELLFRGIIGKQLIGWLGFSVGNTIQAALFGAAHLLLLLAPNVTVAFAIGMVLFTGLMGWINGWLNERHGGGSILPGWAAHGAANLCSYLGVAFATL